MAAVGPGADDGLVGRRVVAAMPRTGGGYAEQAVVDTRWLFEVPEDVGLEQAVPVFQAGAVAVGMLSAMRLAAGETILITAAAGRIGSLLVQAAKTAGARVIGAVGGTAKAQAVTALGADEVVDYSDPDWVGQVRAVTDGHGADLALDAGVIGRRGLTVVGAAGITFAKPAAEQRADAEAALAALSAGRLTPRIHAALALEDAALAHAELEGRRTVGAVLLKP